MSHLLLLGTVSGDVKLALCHEREDYTCKGSSAWGGGAAIFLKQHPQHPIHWCLLQGSRPSLLEAPQKT